MSYKITEEQVINNSRQIVGATDCEFTGTGALLLPRGTTAQRGSPSNGMLRYNTESGAFEGVVSSAWQTLGGPPSSSGNATDLETGDVVTTVDELSYPDWLKLDGAVYQKSQFQILSDNIGTINTFDSVSTTTFGTRYYASLGTNGRFVNIYSSAFTSDSNYMFLGGNSAIAVHSKTGANYSTFVSSATVVGNKLTDIAVTSDNSLLLVASNSDPFLQGVLHSNGTLTTGTSVFNAVPTVAVTRIRLSPDNQWAIAEYSSAPYYTMYKRTGATQYTEVAKPELAPTTALYASAFSSNDLLQLTFQGTGNDVTYQYKNGMWRLTNRLPNNARINAASCDSAITPDGRYMVITSSVAPYVELFEKRGNKFIQLKEVIEKTPSAPSMVKISPNGEIVAVLAAAFCYLYKISNGTLNLLMPLTGSYGSVSDAIITQFNSTRYSCAFSPDNSVFVVTLSNSYQTPTARYGHSIASYQRSYDASTSFQVPNFISTTGTTSTFSVGIQGVNSYIKG